MCHEWFVLQYYRQDKCRIKPGELLMSAFCALSSLSLQDLFKGFARHLSHLLTEDQNPARKTGELEL